MRQNYKFHAVAILIICVVITVLYMLMGSGKHAATAGSSEQSDRAIEIYSATWGENCNPAIQQAIAQRQNIPLEKDKNGMLIERTPLVPVTQNNVLSQLSDLCNGKTSCEIIPTSQALKVEPLDLCAKQLEISYRCYSYDRLWTLTINQGKPKTIECNADSSPATK